MSRRPSKKPGFYKRKHKPPHMSRMFHRPPRTVWIVEQSRPPITEYYTTIKQISVRGQFGTAYTCKRNSDAKIFVMKCIPKSQLYRLHASLSIRQSLLLSMQGELDIMRRLKHRIIHNILDVYENKHNLYCILENHNSETLFDRLVQIGTFRESEAKPIIKLMLNALNYMHDFHRVIHGNLTPHNIIFHNEVVKITDYGISKIFPHLQSLRFFCDTSYYFSPEAFHESHSYCYQCDIWSVGVILYVMLFGCHPFYNCNNECFGQKQNKEICESILKGNTQQKLNLINIETEYLLFGFIRTQQHELNVLHENNTFYTIDPLVTQMIVEFYNDPISKQAYDFMDRLMEKDVSQRLVTKKALNHPWIKSVTMRLQKRESVIGNVPQTEFVALCLFRHIVSDLFSSHFKELKAEQFMFMKEMFIQYDTNEDGCIEFEQFKEVLVETNIFNLNKEQITNAFNKLDARKITKINYCCLIDELIHDYLVATDRTLYEAFRDLDDDEDGKIKTADLKSKVIELNIYGKAKQILWSMDTDLQKLDEDDEGAINYEEFLRVLHPVFNEIPSWFIS